MDTQLFLQLVLSFLLVLITGSSRIMSPLSTTSLLLFIAYQQHRRVIISRYHRCITRIHRQSTHRPTQHLHPYQTSIRWEPTLALQQKPVSPLTGPQAINNPYFDIEYYTFLSVSTAIIYLLYKKIWTSCSFCYWRRRVASSY